jgi:hypothetical protein
MLELDETKVRELAYQLWEKEGRQSGKYADYWHAAEQLLADENQGQVPADAPTVVPLIPLATPLK